jgi:hypothetical protein
MHGHMNIKFTEFVWTFVALQCVRTAVSEVMKKEEKKQQQQQQFVGHIAGL